MLVSSATGIDLLDVKGVSYLGEIRLSDIAVDNHLVSLINNRNGIAIVAVDDCLVNRYEIRLTTVMNDLYKHIISAV